MNRKPTLIAALVLLAGAGAVAFMLNREPATGDGPDTANTPPPRESGEKSGAFTATSDGAKASTRKDERESKDAELVEQYGESRTNLSRHVVGNVVSLLDDAVQMGEMMTNGGGGGFGGGNWALRGVTRTAGVELNDDQQAQLKEIYADFQAREIDKSRNAINSLKENPSTLMSLLLASDARAREEMSEEDYAALQAASAEDLKDVINPLDRSNFRGGQPFEDPDFRSQFEAILEPDQAETFGTKMAENEAKAAESDTPGRDITNIPVMDLESLDQAVGSAQKMTSGFKQVMEGMGGLGPLMEQQRQRSEGGE